jgi:4-alpha-glucanotransferase
MDFQHKSGVLLHVSSLPGPYGIGDLGPEAHAWLGFLAAAHVRWWQVLPLGPTSFGDSPYQSYSSFAANPVLVSPAFLAEDGLIDHEHLESVPNFKPTHVDFRRVIQWKHGLFQAAFKRLKRLPDLHKEFEEFCEQQAVWLNDYSLFMSLKAQYHQRPWVTWPAPLRDREARAIARAKKHHAAARSYFSFQQFLFFRQWRRLRQRMAELNIGLIGDLPIYAAHDSADVWCNRDLFELDKKGKPLRVAGVPPDMFTATGQLWGNPLYRWDAHKRQGYAWWSQRLCAVLGMVDVIRLDHFRGFADYYAVPAGEETAMHGTWETGPGAKFFQSVKKDLGGLPLIAEDLGGERSHRVLALRDRFKLPGMKILQFGFDEDLHHHFLPHNYLENCVAYTGTHDNDTTLGWFQHATKAERKFCLDYLKSKGKHISWDMLKALWASKAALSVAPLQDFLELGSRARMNFPGTTLGNWAWRATAKQLGFELAVRIAELNQEFDRAA